MARDDPPHPDNREQLQELLQDMRVALPGVQVLFAFLLTLPFTNKFDDSIHGPHRAVYFVAFGASAVASALLIAPSVLHRMYHDLHDPDGLDSLLRNANRSATAGTVFLAIALAAAFYLITVVLYHSTVAAVLTALLGAGIAWLWFGLPLTVNARARDRLRQDKGGR